MARKAGSAEKIPSGLEQLQHYFEATQKIMAGYFRDRLEAPERGTIEISGERYILVRAASMSYEFFELVKRLYSDRGEAEARRVASGILFDVAHAIGKADAVCYHKKLGLTDPLEKLSAGPLHFAYSGWAAVDILPESAPSPDENYFIAYDHPHTFEADSWIKSGKQADFPVCIMSAGYSSGWCEESFDIPLVAVEVQCRAAGDEHCRFIMAHPSKIEANLAGFSDRMQGDGVSAGQVAVPEFFHRKRLEEELLSSKARLAAEVEHRTAELRSANVKLKQELEQRMITELALRASEEDYLSLFQDSRDAIYINVRDGSFLDVNQSALDLFGFEREEMLAMSARELYAHAKDRQRFQEIIERDGSVRDFEVKLRRKDGSEIDCLLSSSVRRNPEGQIIGYQGIIHDITDRRLALEALRDSEEKLSAIASTAADGIVLLDNEGRISYWNRAAETMFGYAAAEALGQELHSFLAPDEYYDQYARGFKKFQASGKGPAIGKTIEFTAVRKDGSHFPIEVSVAALKIKDRWHAAGFIRDITEQKLAEEETERIQSQLLQSQKMEAVGNLAGGVAHDFNNLLTAIRGYTDLALMKADDPDASAWYLKQISKASLRAAELTRQLLLFSRKQPMEFVPLDLNRSVGDLQKMIDRLIGEDIVVREEMAEDLWPVRGDSGSIGQVVLNLAVNSRDAMPEGGEIRIGTRNVEIDRLYCRTTPEARPGTFVCLWVSDSGTGITSDVLPHIFEPFFSTKEPGKGTGLGLSVVFGIVKQHEGWITVKSAPDRGSTFEIFFPAFSGQPEEQPGEPESPEQILGRGERILLVEDEDEVRKLVHEALTSQNYDVVSVSSAEEARLSMRREKDDFRLVFSDVVLTDGNGVQLVEELLEERPELGVLLSSGYADQKSQWPAIQEKGYPFIKKPYSLSRLFNTVRTILDGMS